jgi:hypothetical protein
MEIEMAWKQITRKQAHTLYGIPADIANLAENIFFGTPIELPYNYDEPRPLVAFLHNREQSDVVTMYIKTIHPESLENDNGILSNVLWLPIGGYLNLDEESLVGLVEILFTYKTQFMTEPVEERRFLQNVDSTEFTKYHLHPEWFPNSKQEYYIQAYDPLTTPAIPQTITLLNFSRTIGFASIHFAITQFQTHDLQNPNFSPFEHGFSRINLNTTGIKELAMLLQKQKDRLAQ